MISLNVAKYCQKCPKFEPECKKLYCGDGSCITTIFCENDVICANIKLYIEQQQIRCKDCEHNANSPEAGNANCDLFYGMTEQYGFCHKAKRRISDGYSNDPS